MHFQVNLNIGLLLCNNYNDRAMTKTVVRQTYESEINNNRFRLWITVDVNSKFDTVYDLSVYQFIISIQSISIVFHVFAECLQLIAAVV